MAADGPQGKLVVALWDTSEPHQKATFQGGTREAARGGATQLTGP